MTTGIDHTSTSKKRKRGKEMRRFVQVRGLILVRDVVTADHVIE